MTDKIEVTLSYSPDQILEEIVKRAKDKAHLSIAAQVLETVKKEFSK